ncbi:MAG: LacI family DNA-binding transcriptional regulator [Microbacterium sp.]|uniref:DNA-binding LacI/PurR family transcriptional regulator n=1 Tax=Microbacterium natoriense TaxID=284570 RepID=A0AAW8ER32_9MICO|nr:MULTISPECIES: LacI family DNA-binding transcriptional regulator [Microbacterium]MBW8761411.1 LacI family DNA-binding transcriptional regulator [Microbacterium sp.]MDQ0645986.1 DNA-binding LacI/PurR family transcriptional regulator [Microbacterium natoriense]
MSKPKRVTITDIARLAGVSQGAVSFALNGRPGVSEQTRQRILDIAAEHQWQPSSAARALVGARAGVIGFAVNRPAGTLGTEAFFTDLIAGVQSALAERHIAMQMVLVSSIHDEVATYRRWRSANQVDGVIVIDPRDDDPRLAALTELALPAVVIGSHPSADGDPAALWLDDSQVAHSLFDYLSALGHRSIVYVAGPAEFQHTRLRTDVLRGLTARSVTGEVIATDFSPVAASATMRRILSRADRPTAVVFDNDVMAIAGLRIAQEMGLAVPGDLSIASFDDSVVAGLVHPSITSITRDTFGLGADAAAFLLEQIEVAELLDDRVGALPQLTVRESTGAPR